MEKPILATNIDGFLIKHAAFIEPHKAWFDRVIRLTGDKSLEKWKGRKDYFTGVDIAMAKIMPEASDEKRTKQARDWYQQDVIDYINIHPELIYKKAIEVLKKAKSRFILALVTVNTKEHIKQILEAVGISDLYDIVYAIPASEKPDKASLFKNFVQEYGEPKYYIAARSKEAFEECLKLGTLCIYACWDEFDRKIGNIAREKARTPQEMELVISR